MASSNASRISVSSPLTRPISAELKSQISHHLLETGTINAIHAALLHQAQASGWTDALKQRSLELLRSGKHTYGDVMKSIMEEARGKAPDQLANGLDGEKRNGVSKNGTTINGDARTDVKIPDIVVERGMDALKKILESIVDVVTEE